MKLAEILVSTMIVFALLGCGTAKSQSPPSTKTQPQPSPAQAATSQVQPASTTQTQLSDVSFKWIGVDADQLSPTDLKQDSKPDGHFHTTISFIQPSAVKSIWIRYSEFGQSFKWGWIYNKNLPTTGYVIAVFDNLGKPVLPQGDNGYRVNGLTDFDLYISELNNENGRDTLKFEKGETFTLEIDYVTQNNEQKEFDGSVKII
ncbi:putative lipoprotein [Candidatus Desulfosporosinus infrequens]|uniref:Putative lipoprotein n=1 Tax=Candidatus Desulfosporosinus infrequens TaxID=2043169 RepID=A0A2U3K0K2_9FIRM|nr:putative lipoprotein [Candidatus Desulfosporosinus infrequens]